MNIGEALAFAEASVDRIDAQYLLAHLLGISRASLLANRERPLEDMVQQEYRRQVDARARGVPVAYLMEKREFYGRDFFVNEHVLIPRPETEFLVDQALERLSSNLSPASLSGASVLDLGTGSGAIAVTLACEAPNATVTAADISLAALKVASRNAHTHKAAVEFIESDWYSAFNDRRFDLIVSNPPYVAGGDAHLSQGDLRFEPPTALTDGSVDGLASIRQLVKGAPQHLAAGGWLLFEHGYDQAAAAQDLLLKAGFSNLICIKDLARIDRVSGGQTR